MDGSEDEAATRGSLLLSQLDLIFVSDPLIDELGFVHPTQLTTLHASDESTANDLQFSKLECKNSLGSTTSSTTGGEEYQVRADCSRKAEHGVDELDDEGTSLQAEATDVGLPYDTTAFWCGDHKLAISMLALAPIYKCAKAAFMSARTNYKKILQAEKCSGFTKCSETVCASETMAARTEDIHGGKLNIATEKLRLENSLMNYSRALVLINCDYASAWSTRKQIILSKAASQEFLAGELHLAGVVLSCGPKSEETWAYRRWVINQMITGGVSQADLDSLLEGESKLVEAVAGRIGLAISSLRRPWTPAMLLFPTNSTEYFTLMSLFCASGADYGLTAGFLIGVTQMSLMNYRAWRHRCWLVSQMSFVQVAIELHRAKVWATSHVADNCVFHYRRSLLLQLIKSRVPESNQITFCTMTAVEKEMEMKSLRIALLDGSETRALWKEEMDWIKNLIVKYAGREALWIHLRFLLFIWVHHIGPVFSCPFQPSLSAVCKRVSRDPKEALLSVDIEQNFADCCLLARSDALTEAGDRQREFAASYKLWVLWLGSRQHQESGKNGRQRADQVDLNSLKQLLHEVAPHRKQLWDGFLPNF